MKDDVKKALRSYPNAQAMLSGLPEDLIDIFLPDTVEELVRLETNILAFKARSIDREKVMSLQKLCDFPLRPNSSLREVNTRARIQGLKKDKVRRKRRKRGF
jgi:hypothetical protein